MREHASPANNANATHGIIAAADSCAALPGSMVRPNQPASLTYTSSALLPPAAKVR